YLYSKQSRMSTTIERSKGTVRFAFKDSNANLLKNKKKQSLIYLHFTYGSNKFKYSTGYKSCFDEWDYNKQRIKNKAVIYNKDEVNGYLGDLEKFINTKYKELSKEHDIVPKHLLKYALDVKTNKVIPHKVKNKKGMT